MSEQYFASEPSAAHRQGSVHVLLPDLHLELGTDSGVFSPRRLDPGTRLLLDVAPPPPASGNLLDLGCGYGPLAMVLASRSPDARVWAVDVNTRALTLTCANAQRAGLANITCALPDDPGVPAQIDLIWSNPPVRIGKKALHGLLARWLAARAGRDRVSGCATQPQVLTRCTDGWPIRADRRACRGQIRIPGPEGDQYRSGDHRPELSAALASEAR